MSIASQDALISALTSGNAGVFDNSKLTTPAHTAGGWHLLAGLTGYPSATTFPAAADLVFQGCTDVGGDAASASIFGMQHGGNVESGAITKHLKTASALIVGAAGAPWQLKLVDIEGYYRLATTNVTGTGSRVLVNTNTFTANAGTDVITYTNDFSPYQKVRFTTTATLPAGLSLATDYYLVRQSTTTAKVATTLANAIANTTVDITDAGTGTHTLTCVRRNPAGCEAFFVAQTAPTLGGPNLTASSYTNSAGATGRAFQGTPSMGAAADAYATRVLHSGNAVGRYGPFLPRQAGDAGVNSVQSFTWSGGTAYTGSGVVALVIAKPIDDVNIIVPASGALSAADFVNQFPALPRIRDGACLAWMLFGTGATTTASPITTTIGTVWG